MMRVAPPCSACFDGALSSDESRNRRSKCRFWKMRSQLSVFARCLAECDRERALEHPDLICERTLVVGHAAMQSFVIKVSGWP